MFVICTRNIPGKGERAFSDRQGVSGIDTKAFFFPTYIFRNVSQASISFSFIFLPASMSPARLNYEAQLGFVSRVCLLWRGFYVVALHFISFLPQSQGVIRTSALF